MIFVPSGPPVFKSRLLEILSFREGLPRDIPGDLRRATRRPRSWPRFGLRL